MNKLGPQTWMQWFIDPKEDPNTDPFTYFEEKYGYKPTEVIVGDKVNLDVPDSIQIVNRSVAQPYHILVR